VAVGVEGSLVGIDEGSLVGVNDGASVGTYDGAFVGIYDPLMESKDRICDTIGLFKATDEKSVSALQVGRPMVLKLPLVNNLLRRSV